MASTLSFPQGQPLYTPPQCQLLDRYCIEELGINGYELMQYAAQATFGVLISEWSGVSEVIVLCGKGNNGGDGFEIAAIARDHGIQVQLVFDGEMSELKGEAKQAAESAFKLGVRPLPSGQVNWGKPNCVIVDALLGTGTQGAPRGDMPSLIDQANQSGLPILAVDVPSGLNAQTGMCAGAAIQADVTVSMLLNKQGLFTGEASQYVGQIRLAGLGVSQAVNQLFSPSAYLHNWHTISQSGFLGTRSLISHKGQFGHVLLIGGDLGMAGAISLAASAALRCGAGLVSVATRPEHVGIVVGRQPEVMAHGVESAQKLEALIEKANIIAIGPGLGQGAWGQQMLQQVMQSDKPVILDADALNLIAGGEIQHNLASRVSVMTPHPGEASRLLAMSTSSVSDDRFQACQEIAQRYHSHVVLKGAGTLMGDGNNMAICHDGNPGMASGGMGDVLTGVMAGIMAQRETHLADDVHHLVCAAVCLHSAAADEAAKEGQVSLLASDLLVILRQLLN